MSVLTRPDVLCDAIIGEESAISSPKLVMHEVAMLCISHCEHEWFQKRLTAEEWEEVAAQRLEVWGYMQSDNGWWYEEGYLKRD